MRWMVWLTCGALLGCGQEGDGDSGATSTATGTTTAAGTTTTPPTPTATTTATGDLTGSCTQQLTNVLRWDCSFTAGSASALTLTWTPATGGPVRTAESPSGTDHQLTMWGMRAETAITFEATTSGGTVSGTFTTASLTPDVASTATVTGSSTMDGFLSSLGCASATGVGIFDGEGQLIWYQTYSGQGGVGGGGVGGYHFTPDGTVLAFVGGDVYEHTLQGEEILSLSRGQDFADRPLHHDIFRSDNGLTYVLNADAYAVGGSEYVLDGVLILDETGEVAEWSTASVVYPSGGGMTGGFWGSEFPNAIDFTHGNSVWVGMDGVGYLSLRHQNAIMAVLLDPSHMDFGEVQWILTGSTSDLQANLTLVGEEFIGQHNFNPFNNGEFGLFDNHIEGPGPGASGDSRGMVVALDVAGGTATMTESYDMGLSCGAQGSMYETADGNRLVTCATDQVVVEYTPGGASPVFTWDQVCSGGGPGGGGLLARAMPVTL